MMTDLLTTATLGQKPARLETTAAPDTSQSAPHREVVQDVNVQARAKKPAKSDVQDAIKRLNEEVRRVNHDVYFATDDETGIELIKVVDQKTNKVIRQFPPEDIVAVSRKLEDIRGVLFEKSV